MSHLPHEFPRTERNLNIAPAMFSTIAALVTFVAPPTVHLNSMLAMLIKDVLEIVGLTRASNHHELLKFGEYVDRVVLELVLAFKNGRLARQPNVVKNLEELQKTLYHISRQISSIKASRGLPSYTRLILRPEEDDIGRMRQQLQDALNVFQLGALIQLLANGPIPVDGDAVEALEPDQSQTTNPSDHPVHDYPCALRPQASQPAEQARTDRVPPSGFATYKAQPRIRRVSPHHTASATARGTTPEDGQLIVAFANVESLRRSVRHIRSPTKTMELATALGHLSTLLGKAGRIREALDASQESAELYRTLVEGKR